MQKKFSRFARVSFALTVVSFLVYLIAVFIPEVADFVNGSVSVALRAILSGLTYLLPFSLFELLVILSPILLVFVIAFAVRRADTRRDMLKGIISVFAVIALIFTSYLYTLGMGYRTTYLAARMEIDDGEDISPEELYSAITILIDGINREADNLALRGTQTVMPYSVDEMSEKLVRAYDRMNETHSVLTNFKSRVKPIKNSPVMSDLGILGIYSFFTGEANVNVEYPDYYLPFTSAHEMAHQRGISREDEASFVAFLVCIYSDDPYIRYSGYLNMYEYLSSDLYTADRALYDDAYAMLPKAAIADMGASYEVYLRHKDSLAGKINEELNDAYLKANGTEGVASYGYVVRLTVGYYQKQNNG